MTLVNEASMSEDALIITLKQKMGVLAQSVSIHDIESTETALGFRLPELLRKMYMDLGDGGFGPGGGLYPLKVMVHEYREQRKSQENNHPEWPEGLLPICDWGCAITSAIDCSDSSVPVVRVDVCRDPAAMEAYYGPGQGPKIYDKYSNDEFACWIEAKSFGIWMIDWLDGRNLFNL